MVDAASTKKALEGSRGPQPAMGVLSSFLVVVLLVETTIPVRDPQIRHLVALAYLVVDTSRREGSRGRGMLLHF